MKYRRLIYREYSSSHCDNLIHVIMDNDRANFFAYSINPLMSLMQQEVEFTDIGSNEEEMKEQDMVFDKVENTVDTEKCNIDVSSLL